MGFLTLAFALSVRVATVAMERRILAHPQPATDGLELAWSNSSAPTHSARCG
ncbi:hypothetical protein [Microbacterium aurantiacum]|uniref:hypothetical protein n=1 Tax=Microbacterium aurantiacum TaxID=162393 RepID=UPI003D72A560